jgi:hypothetical protein
VGNNYSQITYSYAAGKVMGAARHRTGGVVGFDNAGAGPFLYVYWDMGTTGIKDPTRAVGNVASVPDMTGLTNAAFKSSLPAGLDTGGWALHHGINDGLPYLVDVTPH